MSEVDIPDIVVSRLPIYLRALTRMLLAGQEVTSSQELGKRLGISSAQIRKDLSHFGEFGKQGTGYHITHLYAQLQQILQIDREWAVAVVGIGDLGRALARYGGFSDRGFRVVAGFREPHQPFLWQPCRQHCQPEKWPDDDAMPVRIHCSPCSRFFFCSSRLAYFRNA